MRPLSRRGGRRTARSSRPVPDSGFYEQGLYKLGWSLFKQVAARRASRRSCACSIACWSDDGKLRERDSLTRAERELTDDALRAIAITFSDLEGPESLDAAAEAARRSAVRAPALRRPRQSVHREGTLIRTRRWRSKRSPSAGPTIASRRRCRCAPSRPIRRAASRSSCSKASRSSSSATRSARRSGGRAPCGCARSRRAAEVQPEGPGRIPPRPGAEEQEAGGLHARRRAGIAPCSIRSRMIRKRPQRAYLLAEVLFESGRFAEAAREYERTAYDYPRMPKSAAAGYAALVAYQKHEPTLERRVEGAVASPGHRERADVRHHLPRASGVGARADQGRRRAVRAERLRTRHRSVEPDPRAQAAGRSRSYQRTAATLLAHSLFDRGATTKPRAAYLRAQGFLAAERSGSRRPSKSASRLRSTSRPKRSRRRATRPARSTTSCASARSRRIRRCARTPSSMRPPS